MIQIPDGIRIATMDFSKFILQYSYQTLQQGTEGAEDDEPEDDSEDALV